MSLNLAIDSSDMTSIELDSSDSPEKVLEYNLNLYEMSPAQPLIPLILEATSMQDQEGNTIKFQVIQQTHQHESNPSDTIPASTVQVIFTCPAIQSQPDVQEQSSLPIEPNDVRSTDKVKNKKSSRTQSKTSIPRRKKAKSDLLSCTVCGRHFVSIQRLDSHIKTHTKNRPFECTDCGKTFTVRYSLICHTRVHTRERPYVCGTCKARFSQASSLKTHQIYKHSKDFPYSCQSCGRGFISPGQKHQHFVRAHPGLEAKTSSDVIQTFQSMNGNSQQKRRGAKRKTQ